MSDWVIEATRLAIGRLLEHAAIVGLENTEEFTFRSMFMVAATGLLSDPAFQTEWKRFDLLVQDAGRATLIEFKYYVPRQTRELDGRLGTFKGGAGLKNESEFWQCVQKLRSRTPVGLDDRRLVLVYQRESLRRSRYSFHGSYGQLAPGEAIADVVRLESGPIEARVIRPR